MTTIAQDLADRSRPITDQINPVAITLDPPRGESLPPVIPQNSQETVPSTHQERRIVHLSPPLKTIYETISYIVDSIFIAIQATYDYFVSGIAQGHLMAFFAKNFCPIKTYNSEIKKLKKELLELTNSVYCQEACKVLAEYISSYLNHHILNAERLESDVRPEWVKKFVDVQDDLNDNQENLDRHAAFNAYGHAAVAYISTENEKMYSLIEYNCLHISVQIIKAIKQKDASCRYSMLFLVEKLLITIQKHIEALSQSPEEDMSIDMKKNLEEDVIESVKNIYLTALILSSSFLLYH